MSLTKRLIALAVLLMALPTVAFASTSRVEALAPGDYIKDYTGIYTYLSGLTTVGNLVYAEIGNELINTNNGLGKPTTSDRAMGVVLGSRFGTWGIHLREETPAIGLGDHYGQPNVGFGGADANGNTNESFDVMWGNTFGALSLGLRINRSFFKAEFDDGTGITSTLEFDPVYASQNGTPLARNVMGYGAGAGFQLNENMELQGSIQYQTRTWEDSETDNFTDSDDGGANYLFAARMMWQRSPNLLIVPVFKYSAYDFSNKYVDEVTDVATSFENTVSGWQLGVAGNWALRQNDLFILGVAFGGNSIDQKQDLFDIGNGIGFADDLKASETLSPLVFAGLETSVTSWLQLRFGAQKGMFHTLKVEERGQTNNETAEFSLSDFSMSLGAGVKVGTLQFDALVSNSLYHELGNLVSRDSDSSGSYFPKVSATYSW